MDRPSRLLIRPLILGLGVALASSSFGQPLAKLEPDSRFERPLRTGQSDRFSLVVEANTYFQVEVETEGLDLTLILRDPQQSSIKEVRLKGGRGKVAGELYWPLERAGQHTLEVVGTGPAGGAGRYRLAVEAWRPATEKDRLETPAYYAYLKADQLKLERRDLKRAIGLYRQSLAVWQQLEKADWAASTLDNIGFCFRLLQDLEGAIEPFRQALPWWRRAGDETGEINTLINLGSALWRTDRLDLAQEAAQKALALLDVTRQYKTLAKKKKQQAIASNQLGLILKDRGRLSDARTHLERAAQLHEAVGYSLGVVRSLVNLGSLMFDLGEVVDSNRYLVKALVLVEKSSDGGKSWSEIRAAALSNLAVNRGIEGELFKALELYQEALDINRKLSDLTGQAEVLRNLGTLYLYLGDLRRAFEHYSEAHRLNQKLGRRIDVAGTLANVGRVHAQMGNREAASRQIELAVELLRPLQTPGFLATALETLGKVRAESGEAQDARRALQEALTLARQIPDRRRQARIGVSLGELHRRAGEKAEAAAAFATALKLSSELGDLQYQAAALVGQARLARIHHRLDDARSCLGEALDLLDLVRANAGDPYARASFLALHNGTFDLAIEIEIDLHHRHPEAGHDRAAFALNERARARSLLDQIAMHAEESVTAELLAEDQHMRQRLNSRELYRLRIAQETPVKTELLRQLEREITGLVHDYRALRAKIEQQRSAGRSPSTLVELPELRRDLLDSDTVMLAYRLGEERGYLWAITPETVEMIELPGRAEIESLVERWRALLNRPDAARDLKRREAARRLGQLLIQPVAQLIAGKRLAILADGSLHAFPFAVLPSPSSTAGFRPLIVDHELVYLPSASVLRALRRKSATRQAPGSELAILADAVFERTDSRLKRGTVDMNEPALSRAFDPFRLGRLTQSAREAELITALAGERHVLTALGFSATRELFLGGELERFRILHLATHGLVHEAAPELSGLMFSNFDSSGQPIDGFVRVADITASRFRAELVTLSACQSALGEAIRGEGLFSVGRGFLEAGVPRVIATLWSIEDEAATELMKLFYEGILRHGLTAPAALRRAQVSMWEKPAKPGWQRPTYWAPFVLLGDWR